MLKMLIIGGGRQIGKAILNTIDTSMIEVSIINRGVSSMLGSEYYRSKNVKYIKGDRSEFVNKSNLEFDIVLDTCAYDPVQYSKELRKWKEYHGKYIFISSAYVYNYDKCHICEKSSLLNAKKINSESNQKILDYGIKKIECEKIALETLSDLLIMRPGVLLSKYDHTCRIEKWISRANSGFYPNDFQKKWTTQFLSTDDFANFILKCINKDINGILNVAGSPITLEQFWDTVLEFKESIKISKEFECSSEFQFFEKQSRAIIQTNKAEKFGMNKTNSSKLLFQILKSKCKEY